MTLVVIGYGETLSLGNSSKENEQFKGKYEVGTYERTHVQENVSRIKKELEKLSNLEKEVNAHGTPSYLASKVDYL